MDAAKMGQILSFALTLALLKSFDVLLDYVSSRLSSSIQVFFDELVDGRGPTKLPEARGVLLGEPGVFVLPDLKELVAGLFGGDHKDVPLVDCLQLLLAAVD
jgi:hypothetical protein